MTKVMVLSTSTGRLFMIWSFSHSISKDSLHVLITRSIQWLNCRWAKRLNLAPRTQTIFISASKNPPWIHVDLISECYYGLDGSLQVGLIGKSDFFLRSIFHQWFGLLGMRRTPFYASRSTPTPFSAVTAHPGTFFMSPSYMVEK